MPFFLLITGFLYFYFNGKPFFLQSRPGRNERLFTIIKFRTITDSPEIGFPVCTSVIGTALRASSIDELPQLLNVLRGDMSLVGPRPLLSEYLPLYSERQRLRHAIVPGITGLAQVNGGNLLSWEEKFEYDIQYAEQISFLMDLEILGKTIKNLLKRDKRDNHEKMPCEKFKGNFQS